MAFAEKSEKVSILAVHIVCTILVFLQNHKYFDIKQIIPWNSAR